MEIQYIVNTPCRIHDILQKNLNISNRLLTFLIKQHLIKCNGIICNTQNIAQSGDIITVLLDYDEDNSNIIPTKMPLDIIYEDDWLLVINKPSGIAIHPSILHYTDSLSNGVCYYFKEIGLNKKIRPVNRLDLHTSGIVVFAKCAYIHEQLSVQMQNGTFSKTYIAMIHGKLSKSEGIIDLPISRKPGSIIERRIDLENGKKSITKYRVLNYFENENTTLIQCDLLTGRTHQIRVHFSSIGHPLVGDSLYGNDLSDTGQILHCSSIAFIHPITKQKLHFEVKAKWAE